MAISRKVLLCVCVFVFSVLQPPAAQAGVVTYPSLDITGNGPTVSSDYTLRVTPGGIKMAGAEYAAGITLQKNASLDVAGSVEILNDSTRYFTGIDTEGGSIQVAGDVTLLARNGSGGNSAIDAGRDDWDIIDIGGSLIVSADSGTYSNSGIFAINTDVSIGRDILLSGGEKSRGVYMVGQWDETRRGILSVGGDVVVLNGVENTGVAIHDKVDGFLYKDLIVQDGQRSAGATVKGSGILTLYGDTIVAGGVRNTGVNTYYGGLANVFGDLSVGGTDSIGLHADWQGTINMTGGQVTADDSNIKGVFALTSEAAINLTDVSGGSVDTMLIWANGVDNTVTFSGSNLKGNVGHSAYYASDDWQGREGRLSITLSDDSTLTGAINGAFNSPDWHIDVTLNNPKDMWFVTADSHTQGVLNMGNNSTVDYSPSALGTTVMVDDLKGTGNFIMKSDIAAETADRLVVEKTSSGTHLVKVLNDGSAATTGKERTMLIETADTGAEFVLENGVVDAGAWQYVLRNNNDGRGRYDEYCGQYWELYSTGGASNPGSAGVNTVIGNYFLAYAETDTLIKRLGDLRSDMQHSKHGAWFRGFGGKMESDARQYVRGFDMDYWGVQVGYDNLLERETSWFKNGDTYVGGFVGMSKGDLDFNQTGYGTGDIEHHTMGMYWTYIGDTGYYFDAIAKYVWSKNEFNVQDSAGAMVQGGHLNTGGVGMSLEMGRRFRFDNEEGLRPSIRDGQESNGNWYLEPQAQLSWQYFGSGMFHADNGLRIGVSNFDSLIGRLGLLLGYESAKTNIYVKAFYLKEFQGDLDVYANDVVIFESLDDDWWVYGIGLTHQLNPRNALYIDLETGRGGDFENKWRINAGWRISF